MRENRPSPHLPSVDPGQIWLIEHDSATALGALDRAVLTHANVVLYDRALAPLVAQVLPIGAYAEPLSAATVAAGPAVTPRALDFAAEGWSVVQLVAAGPVWRARVAALPPALFRASRDNALPVRVVAKDSSGHERAFDAGHGEFAALIRGVGASARRAPHFG